MTEKSQRQKSEKEWREELDEETYRVTREGGTEPAFSGEYWDEEAEGVYRCACCGEPLFSSDTKYESGTGWPSFWSVLDEGSVDEREDRKLASPRTEIVCSRCDAHLGHVFPDGPEPTGQRYCINSAALELERTEDD